MEPYRQGLAESYCVKQKKFTECIEPKGYKKSKNGKLMFYCKCKECGIMKYKFVKNQSGGSFDQAIVETMGNLGKVGLKLGKVGLSKAIKSKTVKRASAKMVDKMLDNIADNIK